MTEPSPKNIKMTYEKQHSEKDQNKSGYIKPKNVVYNTINILNLTLSMRGFVELEHGGYRYIDIDKLDEKEHKKAYDAIDYTMSKRDEMYRKLGIY